jgi:NAD(P)H dehydrogenase (quinone)
MTIQARSRPLANVDGLFLITAYTVDMLRQSKRLIDHARRAGVKHIVHLGACGDDDTDIAHYGWHQYIERYIEWSQIPIHPPSPRNFHAESSRLRWRQDRR